MAQTKPKAGQFYGVSNNGTAGQVLISDGNGGMSWGANTENYTVSWATPTGQGLTYTQPNPQSSVGPPGSSFPTTTFTVTKSGAILSGTATIANLPTGITATQVITGSGAGNTLTVTLAGVFPSADSLNTALIISGLTVSNTVSWATPTGQSLTYTQPNPQSSQGAPGSAFPTTTFTATKSSEEISGTATIAGLPTGITATQSLSGSGANNILTVTLAGVFPGADSLNTALTISGLTLTLPLTVDYLVVAGGGSGAWQHGGGGGAGGLRTSYPGSTTGGGGSAENTLTLVVATNYLVTVGAGAASGNGVGGNTAGNNGSNSIFGTITSTGGGGGSSYVTTTPGNGGSGGGGGNQSGGSQGGGSAVTSPAIQGYAGGTGGTNAGNYPSGGGGGAGGTGINGSGSVGGSGGVGLSVSITGTGVYYAGGGGSGTYNGGTPGTGGNGGGGAGVSSGNSNSGTPNTGGGGGGVGISAPSTTGGGGSGIVILRYTNSFTISGLSGTTTTVGTDKVTTFTNVGTGNIQFN